MFGAQVQARDVAPVATSPVDSNIPPQDQRKTFSKRKIVSNWEKYDEGVYTHLLCNQVSIELYRHVMRLHYAL